MAAHANIMKIRVLIPRSSEVVVAAALWKGQAM
jgi:hypothetical protein